MFPNALINRKNIENKKIRNIWEAKWNIKTIIIVTIQEIILVFLFIEIDFKYQDPYNEANRYLKSKKVWYNVIEKFSYKGSDFYDKLWRRKKVTKKQYQLVDFNLIKNTPKVL